jgi:tRNA(fMet)-specific endonuclease VapC
MILLDTNILIEIFKGNGEIIDAVFDAGPENLSLCSITAMELYYGALNKLELQRIRKNLGAFRIIHLSTSISEVATLLIERYAKSHGLQIPDALIAATALETQSELFTLNIKDFTFISGLSLKGAVTIPVMQK